MAKATEERAGGPAKATDRGGTRTHRVRGIGCLEGAGTSRPGPVVSVGAIYTVFGDLGDLLVAVNGETFRRPGRPCDRHPSKRRGAVAPHERMVAMAEGYLDYAQRNPNLWRALFAVALTDESDVPEWYLAALNGVAGADRRPPCGSCFPSWATKPFG